MSKKCESIPSCSAALREVLLVYLQFSDGQCFPGGDGLTVDDALACYPQALAAGLVPDKKELLRLHPELQNELHRFFAG